VALKRDIASVRAELARAKGTTDVRPPPVTASGIPAGSWPANAELRRAVEDTIRRLAR